MKTPRPWHLAAAALVFAPFPAWVLPGKTHEAAELSPGIDIPDLTFWYSGEHLLSIFEALGPEGRARYIHDHLVFDVLWPLAYTYVFFAILGNLWRALGWHRGAWRNAWLWLALTPFALDMVENLSGVAVASAWPDPSPTLASISASFTTIKWCSVGGVMLVILGATGLWLARRRAPAKP